MFHPVVHRARRMVRTARGRALRLGSAPIRAGAATAIRLLPGSERRLSAQSWLWQPGWGRAWHERHYRRPDPDGISSSAYHQAKDALIIEVLDQLDVPERRGRVLEVGCGEGRFTSRLAAFGGELLAVDISDAAIRRARPAFAGQPKVVFERRTLPLDMPEGTFDLIVCSDVLYFWEPRTLRRGLDRLLGCLRPGGRMLLLHQRENFGQPSTADAVHEAARGRALHDPGLRHELSHTLRHVGPGGAGIRIDVVTRVATAGPRAGTGELPQQLRHTPVDSRLWMVGT